MSHDKFQAYLAASRRAVLAVADYMLRSGFDVMIDAYRTTRSDDGDLFIRREGMRGWWRIEVRHHFTNNWTCKDDFKYDQVVVGPVRNTAPGIHSFIHVSQDMQHAYSVRTDQQKAWVIRSVVDEVSGQDKDNYFMPKDLAKFYPLTSEGKSI